MNRKRKADARATGIGFVLKTDSFTGGDNKAFSKPNYTVPDRRHQCQKCSIYESRLRQMETQCDRLATYIDRLECGP
jgi:hypothetical protein